MKQAVPLGRVAGIRFGMHWSVLVMVIMIGWLLGGQVLPETTPGQPAVAYWAVAVPCAIAFMATLLAHELAHSLVARRPGNLPVHAGPRGTCRLRRDVTARACYCPSPWQRTNRAISARSTWPGGQVNFAHLRAAVRLAVWFLDDVIDVNRCPVPELDGPARAARKMGLGVMGLAEAVLGVRSR